MRKTKSFIVNVVLALLCLCCIVTGFTFMKGNKRVSAQEAETPQVAISTKQMSYIESGTFTGYRGSADGDTNLYQYWSSWGGLFSGKNSASAIVFKVPADITGSVSLEFHNLQLLYGTTGLKLCILRRSGTESVADVVYPSNGKWRDFNGTANSQEEVLTVSASAGDSFYFTLFDSTGIQSPPDAYANVYIPFVIKQYINGQRVGESWDASKTHWENPELGDTTTTEYFGGTYKYSELCDYETVVINSTVDVVDAEGNILDTITSLSGKNGVLPTVTVGNTTYTSYTVNGETVQAGETMFFDLTNEPIVVKDYETIATLSFTGTDLPYNSNGYRMATDNTNFVNMDGYWEGVIQSGVHTATAVAFNVPDDVVGTASLTIDGISSTYFETGVYYSVVHLRNGAESGTVVYPTDGSVWKELAIADTTQGTITVEAQAGDKLYFMVYNPNQTAGDAHESYIVPIVKVTYGSAVDTWWDPTKSVAMSPEQGEADCTTQYFGKTHKNKELISYESVVFNSNLTVKSESGDTLKTLSAPSTGLVLPEVPVTDKQQLGYFYDGKIIPVGETVYVFNDSEIIAVYIDKTDFTMQNGASIRVTEPAGIRFSTLVSDGLKTRIDNASTYGLTVKLGGLITKSSSITVDEELDYSLLTTEANFYFLDVEKKTDFLTSETAGYAQYNTCVVGLDSSLYNTAFTAIAYMQVTYENGTTKTFYATAGDTSRSIKQVATAAYNDESSGFYHDGRLDVYMN